VKKLIGILQKMRLRQVLSLFFVGVLVFVTTACNAGDVRGARPNNPPVQMGGNNNPHKTGGDSYTNYKMSTDPAAKQATPSQRDRADAQLNSAQLVAVAGAIESDASNLLYPGSDATSSRRPTIGTRGQDALESQLQRLPVERQSVLDRSDPDSQILERVGQQFEDASKFLQDTADSARDYPEMQANPGARRR